MSNKAPDNKPSSILFVCYGNVCRSPMAEGLAKHLIGSSARIESAGLAPLLSGATPDAVATLSQLYDVDISHHKAKSIADISINLFECIIVLDRYVFDLLKNRFPSHGDIFILWDIEDPFGKDMEAYRQTAEKIKKLIEKYLVPLYSV